MICELIGPLKDEMVCPKCDGCPPETLENSCNLTKIEYLFDNGASIFFAFFMSMWSVVFIECWKRYSAGILNRWNEAGYDPDEVIKHAKGNIERVIRQQH